MAAIPEVCSVRTIVDGLEDEPHYLLYDLVPGAWNSKFPHLSITFRDIGRSYRFRLVPFSPHFFNECLYLSHSKTVNGFFVCAWGHIPGLGLDALVSQDIDSGLNSSLYKSELTHSLFALSLRIASNLCRPSEQPASFSMSGVLPPSIYNDYYS